MSVTHSNTESESIIKDDQKNHKHVSSSKRKRYRSRNPQSLQKFKELIARKKAARKRNKKLNKSISSQVHYIPKQSKRKSYDQIKPLSIKKKSKKQKKEKESETEKENKEKVESQTHSHLHSEINEATQNTNDTLFSFISKSTSYDQIKPLPNQKKVKKTKKEKEVEKETETEKENQTETENQTYSHSHSKIHEATENTNGTDSLFFTPSELNLSDIFLTVLESKTHSDSYSTLFETKSNSNSHDTTASMEENEEEEVNDEENPADESSCCQCLWIISIIGTIFLLAIFGPNAYYNMTKIEVKDIRKDVNMGAQVQVKDDWEKNIDQLFTAFENKKTYENMAEFKKFRDICFDKKKDPENSDQLEYLKRKRKELCDAIPKFILLDKAKIIDKEKKIHNFNEEYVLDSFDEKTKKPDYISRADCNIHLTYYKGLWSIIKLIPESKNEYEVRVRWKLSGDVIHPGQLESTKYPAEMILPHNNGIHSTAEDEFKKSINPELDPFYQ